MAFKHEKSEQLIYNLAEQATKYYTQLYIKLLILGKSLNLYHGHAIITHFHVITEDNLRSST